MEAVLKIYGDIGTDVTDVMVADFLDSNKEADNITVRINSFGGSVQDGWNIYDLLKTSGKKIKTVGEGRVYSIATVIFLAGTEREMLPNADGVIHMPRITDPTGTFQADDFRNLTLMMDQEENKILNLYIQVTGRDGNELAELMRKETTLSAADMVTMGFATKITEQYKAVAHFNFKSKINMTENDVKSFGEKLDALGKSITALFSRLPLKDQTLTDKDGKELKLEKESGGPEVGDKASPDGVYTLTDGRTITVTDGAVSAIGEKAEDKSELEIANAKIAELEAKIAEVQNVQDEAVKAKAEAEAAKVAVDAKEIEVNAIMTELKALKNTWKPEGRNHQNFTSGKVGAIDLDRVKELNKQSKN